MFELLSFLSIPIGFICGAIIGVAGSGYLIIFGSMSHIDMALRHHDYKTAVACLIALLFTKLAIFFGGILGACLGCIPGIAGLYHAAKKNAEPEDFS